MRATNSCKCCIWAPHLATSSGSSSQSGQREGNGGAGGSTESKPTIRARHGQTDMASESQSSRPYALDWARTEALRGLRLEARQAIPSAAPRLPLLPLAWHSMSETQLFMRFRRFRAIRRRLPASSMTMSHEHVALTFRAKNQQLERDRQSARDRERERESARARNKLIIPPLCENCQYFNFQNQ